MNPSPRAVDSAGTHTARAIAARSRRTLRVGVVGARRQQQGCGEHVARLLAAQGAQVCGIVGTRPETLEAAQRHLHEAWGLAPRGYLDVPAMLAAEDLDAVAICSPDRFHRQHLLAALDYGVHALCEKPVVAESGRDWPADARLLVDEFARSGLVLMANEQWPFTLPYFQRLYPNAMDAARTPQYFTMWLSPSVAGAAMIPNSLPHVLSMLYCLAPAGGTVCDANITVEEQMGGVPTSLIVSFRYVHQQGATHVEAHLRQTPQQPRPAGYAIDGHAVRRVLQMPQYAMFLEGGSPYQDGCGEARDDEGSQTRLPLPDPLELLIAEFVRRVQEVHRTGVLENDWIDHTLIQRLAALQALDRLALQKLDCN